MLLNKMCVIHHSDRHMLICDYFRIIVLIGLNVKNTSVIFKEWRKKF